MYEGKTVAVVVPAYNEEKLIGTVLDTMPDFVDLIIVVDDASTDRTSDIVAAYHARLAERLVYLHHAHNQGVGAATPTLERMRKVPVSWESVQTRSSLPSGKETSTGL